MKGSRERMTGGEDRVSNGSIRRTLYEGLARTRHFEAAEAGSQIGQQGK